MTEQVNDVAVLDLSAAKPVDSTVIEILFAGSTKPTGWKIEIAGPAHPKTQAITDEITRENLDKEKAVEFAQINGRKWKKDNETTDERREKNYGRICRRIIGWTPNPMFPWIAPTPFVFSEKVATDLFLRPDMQWAFGQITEYLNSETAFTNASATN